MLSVAFQLRTPYLSVIKMRIYNTNLIEIKQNKLIEQRPAGLQALLILSLINSPSHDNLHTEYIDHYFACAPYVHVCTLYPATLLSILSPNGVSKQVARKKSHSRRVDPYE